MWDGFDKRKFPRLALQCEILIHSQTQPRPISTMTENVGIGGLCVILDRELDRFEKCRVRLELKSPYRPIGCLGQIVWTVPTRQVKSRKFRFDTGIEFLDLEPDLQASIRSFIETRPASLS